MDNLGGSIKKYRKRAGITQKKLAELIDISTNAMNFIEKNRAFPSKKTLDKIAEVLEIPLPFILFDSISSESIPVGNKMTFEFIQSMMDSLLIGIQLENKQNKS